LRATIGQKRRGVKKKAKESFEFISKRTKRGDSFAPCGGPGERKRRPGSLGKAKGNGSPVPKKSLQRGQRETARAAQVEREHQRGGEGNGPRHVSKNHSWKKVKKKPEVTLG